MLAINFTSHSFFSLKLLGLFILLLIDLVGFDDGSDDNNDDNDWIASEDTLP